eukprot:TRINITY_DN888_c0_g1_i2.p1 TRINITY_DN888_c0_g1~~TRINITY_DN888_c0_g1_i2.p1  ORF type:complete len:175 (-),score=19.47 TRINITY_DN888_c0_g1_i2:517-978(-)
MRNCFVEGDRFEDVVDSVLRAEGAVAVFERHLLRLDALETQLANNKLFQSLYSDRSRRAQHALVQSRQWIVAAFIWNQMECDNVVVLHFAFGRVAGSLSFDRRLWLFDWLWCCRCNFLQHCRRHRLFALEMKIALCARVFYCQFGQDGIYNIL